MSMRVNWRDVIIPRVAQLLQSYDYRPTLRQIFYRLVAELLIPNTEAAYKSLSRASVEAREDRRLDPLAFEDRVRSAEGGDYGWESPQAFVHQRLQDLTSLPYVRPLWTRLVNNVA